MFAQPKIIFKKLFQFPMRSPHKVEDYVQFLKIQFIKTICHLKFSVPQHFSTKDWFCGRRFFHGRCKRNRFRKIQTHDIYCALYFLSNAAAGMTGGTSLWPGDWAPLTQIYHFSFQKEVLFVCVCFFFFPHETSFVKMTLLLSSLKNLYFLTTVFTDLFSSQVVILIVP